MAESVHTNFPSQVVSDLEKITEEYGLKIAKAIELEWFDGPAKSRATHHMRKYHNLRLYARGEQSIQKYKDELSINGDLSYLNLDWTPVPIIPKFVDIVVNGMAGRGYELKAYSQDQYGVAKRTEYMESMIADMQTKEFNESAKNQLNIDMYENDPAELPETKEELELHMQLNYKQAVEVANETAINTLLDGCKYDLTRRRVLEDLTVLGIGATKTTFNWAEGAKVEYVDPASLVYSYTESPYFEDIYYVGEVKYIPINELAKEFTHLTHEDLKDIRSKYTNRSNLGITGDSDKNKVAVLYFNYKTYMNDVYKVKKLSSGAEKSIQRDDSFKPPSDAADYSRLQRSVECLFEGALVLGTNRLLKWKKADNMMRTKSDFNKVKMNYSIVAPKMYNGRIESLVGRITSFADMIQLTHLKLQQVLSRMVPDGVYLDIDGLAEVDLGNGTNYNAQEALNMFFQTGSVVGRSFTGDGDQNPGKIPIQEISNGAGAGNKLQALIGNYNYYLQMIRDVTGLNEARDASTPDSRSLVGIQKLAAANSNVATRHILDASLFLTVETAEQLSLRISDILEYSPTADAFIQQIGAHNVATLKEMSELHLYDFGIFIDLMPDEEERQILENNIQMAIQQKSLDVDDAIDIRQVKNLKMANQLIKYKKKKKLEREQAMQQQNIKSQGESQQQTAQAAAQSEMQKNEQKVQMDMQLEEQRNGMKIQFMKEEAAMKIQLMDHEFEINMKLRQMDNEAAKNKDSAKDDRADERERIKGSQQSNLIAQKKNETEPKNFESAGNDTLGSGLGVAGLTSN
tara:strand:- start:1342 stop:3744 length:2403 start_codon:yes stop_codon:yes gene_type:complete